MVKVIIEINKDSQEFYNLDDSEMEILMANLKPLKESLEANTAKYLHNCLRDLQDLKEEINKDMKWEC